MEQTDVMSRTPSTTVNTHTVLIKPCRFPARLELLTNLNPSVRTWFPYYGVQRRILLLSNDMANFRPSSLEMAIKPSGLLFVSHPTAMV